MYYLLYQAYGSDEIAYEAIYSLLSLYKFFDSRLPENIRPVIYTDREALFRKWLTVKDVTYHPLPVATVIEWKGEINFVHRVKIKVLQDFYKHHSDSVLYVDTDTNFLQSPLPVLQQIAAGQQMMHRAEYSLSDNTPYARKISKQILQHSYPLADGTGISIPADTQMWNAGAIGLPANSENLLQQVLELTDELYRNYPKHIMEQLAFSYVLRQNGSIKPLEDYIFHYWNFKEYREFLVQFFQYHRGKKVEELVQIISTIDPGKLIQPKLAFRQLPGWRRALLRLSGKAWKMEQYNEFLKRSSS